MDCVPKFSTEEWVRIAGRGWMAVVTCDQDRDRDHTGLEGTTVSINDELFFCVGVERHMPRGPIKEGEKIGLLVREHVR